MLPQGHQTYNSSNEKKNWVRDSDTWVRNNYEKMFILTSSSTVVVDVNVESKRKQSLPTIFLREITKNG